MTGEVFGLVTNCRTVRGENVAVRSLGAVANVRKATLSFVMYALSFRPSVRLAWIQLCSHRTDFYEFLIFEYFSNICRKKFKFYSNLTIMTGALHDDLCAFMTSRPILLRMRNISDKSCRGKSKHIYFRKSPPLENRAFYEIIWECVVGSDRPQLTILRIALHAG